MNQSTIMRCAAAVASLWLAGCGDETAPRYAQDRRMQSASEQSARNTPRVVDFQAQRHAGPVTRDAAISATVREDLLEFMSLAAVKIHVETVEGVVTLKGAAPDRDATQRATRIAQSVEGVREVRNYLMPRRG